MRKFTNFGAEMLKKKNTKTCLANEVKENQEGFPKLSLGGREGGPGRLGGSTLVALSLSLSAPQ
jgi:hypothetical protein